MKKAYLTIFFIVFSLACQAEAGNYLSLSVCLDERNFQKVLSPLGADLTGADHNGLIYCIFQNTSDKKISVVLPNTLAGASCYAICLSRETGQSLKVHERQLTEIESDLSELPRIEVVSLDPGAMQAVALKVCGGFWDFEEVKNGKYTISVEYKPNEKMISFYKDLGIIGDDVLVVSKKSDSIPMVYVRRDESQSEGK